jgi:DNA-directed RNA polymerase specialized sigma24 family protein
LADGNVAATDASLRMLQWVIDEALEPLPDIQRRMIEMRIQGHSVAEIADLTKRCRRTVERVMRQFRDAISDELASEGSDADD